MSRKNDTNIAAVIRTVGICIGIAAFLIGAIEAYVSNKYETKENYILATNATQQLSRLKEDIYKQLNKIDDDLHTLDIKIRVLQERVTKLPS